MSKLHVNVDRWYLLQIRVSEAQKLMIQRALARAGMNMSSYVVIGRRFEFRLSLPKRTDVEMQSGRIGDATMSAITFSELEFGVSVCSNPARERRNLQALVELIAAHAIELQTTLVTDNDDFAAYRRLVVVNWIKH